MLKPSDGQTAYAQELRLPQRWLPATDDVRPFIHHDTLTICILGDVMMHKAQIENSMTNDGRHDFSTWFEHIRDRISSADIAIANMEFTFAGEPYSGYPAFSAPDETADYMAECGFDILLAANNHIYDKGSRGAVRTLDIYRQAASDHGIMFTGLSGDQTELERTHPLIIRKKNIGIALINCTYGTNLGIDTHWPKTNYINDRKSMCRAFEKAESDADFTIVLPHWGTEYTLRHNTTQEAAAEWMISEGADMIIGSHPHTVQDTALMAGDVTVAYSLGNAVSNMSAPDTQIGLMAHVRLIRTTDGTIRREPVTFTYLWCSRPGGYNDRYTVLPVKDFIGTRSSWEGPWEYDKMVTTYRRVMQATGITDK